MVPGVISKFLDRASVAAAGTRDRDLVPSIHRVCGWWLEEDSETMRCLVPAAFTKNLIENLTDNQRFAVTIEEIGPHETYQFKGAYLDSEPCGDRDLAVYAACRDRFVKVVGTLFGFPPEASRAFSSPPELVVRLKIEEIYLQTPGPGAGRRLVPPEAK